MSITLSVPKQPNLAIGVFDCQCWPAAFAEKTSGLASAAAAICTAAARPALPSEPQILCDGPEPESPPATDFWPLGPARVANGPHDRTAIPPTRESAAADQRPDYRHHSGRHRRQRMNRQCQLRRRSEPSAAEEESSGEEAGEEKGRARALWLYALPSPLARSIAGRAANGAEGTRTLDPRLAKPMLSQLSYGPRESTFKESAQR